MINTKPIREPQIEKYLVEQVKAMGGEVRKVKWIGRKKAPDRVLFFPSYVSADSRIAIHHVPIWVEVKRPGKKAKFPADAHERGQHREHERMRGMGQQVEVIDSFDGVDRLLQEMRL